MSSLDFRLKIIDEARYYISYEIKHIDVITEKHKKTCKYLNYVRTSLF